MFCDKRLNTTNLQIWIKLTDSAGKPYNNVRPTKVTIPSNADLDDFRDAVKAKFANTLSSVDSAELCFYQNQPALDANIPLEDGSKLSELSFGRSTNDALIVVVPSLPVAVPPNQQTSLSFELSDESCPFLSFPKDDVLVKIPWSYVKDSGLIKREKAVLVLYRRPEFEKQWDAMTTYVFKNNVVLWLLGPPGTGKSCAAFAFACSLDRIEWNIVWVHYSKEKSHFKCIQFDGDQKLICTVSRRNSEQIPGLLTFRKKTFVIFDGYVDSMKNKVETDVLPLLREWRDTDNENRRLLCVCSMVSLGKDYRPDTMDQIRVKNDATHTETRIFEEMSHTVESWRLEDYNAALNVAEFCNSVKDNFVTNENDENNNEQYETVETKFFVVGGSARLMFNMTLDMAMDVLSNLVKSIENIESYLRGAAGDRSSSAINRLFALYKNDDKEYDAPLVSTYVARILGRKMGPDFILRFADIFRLNPSTDGHIFEMWFFAELEYKGITYRNLTGQENTWDKFEKISFFNPDKCKLNILVGSPTWLAPIKWNQGGYDAVYVDWQLRMVRFIQVTRAKEHTFNSKHFCELLWKLKDTFLMEVDTVELYFVVPLTRLEEFKLPVDTLEFQNKVINVALLSGKRTDTVVQSTASLIEVVGVSYELYENRPVEGDFVQKKRRKQEY